MSDLDVVTIVLTQGYVTCIDAADQALVMANRPWHYHAATGYARSLKHGYLHRFLLGLSKGDGLQGDHINRDRLDNRRCNLRIVTYRENAQNKTVRRDSTTGFRGVLLMSGQRRKPYLARVTANGEIHNLGYFATAEEAGARAALGRARLMTHCEEVGDEH